MANELTAPAISKSLPTLPDSLQRRIRVSWNATFDVPTTVAHDLMGEERKEAYRIVGQQLAACGSEFAGAWLAKLKAVLVTRSRDESDMRAWAVVMLQELSKLPADLVVAACQQWLEREKYLPAPAELRGLMEPELTLRRRMRAALERPPSQRNGNFVKANEPRQQPAHPEPKRVSDEAERIIAEMRAEAGPMRRKRKGISA